MDNTQVKKNKRKINFYLLYQALAYDWLFFYAIDSIYYADVKHMSFSSISLLMAILSISYVIIQIPMVRIVRKMRTVTASRIGTFLYLLAALMLFLGPWAIYVEQVIFATGMALKNVSDTKILKDNLKMYGLSENYSKYCGIIKFVYAALAAVASVAAGLLYEVWVYAPVVICCGIMFIAFVMSFFITNEKENYKKANGLPLHSTPMEKHEYFKLFKFKTTWLLLLFSAIFYAIISCLMDINKLVFQEFETFSALTITIVVAITRVVRALTALGFNMIYKRLKFNSIFIVLAVMIVGVLTIGLGGLFTSGTTALAIIGIGSSLLYSTRDPFHIVREDFVMNSNGLTKRQSLLAITNIGCYLGRFICSFTISGLLLSQSAATTNLIIIAALAPFAIVLSILLSRKRKANRY